MYLGAARFLAVLLSLVIPSLQTCANDVPAGLGLYPDQEPPGNTPKLFAPGIVSTGTEHSAAMFTPDGKEIWFGRMFPAKIYLMEWSDGKWSEPRVAPFCETFKYLYPVLTNDGNRIFFSSDRPAKPEEKRLRRGQVAIWMVERMGAGWSEPNCLNENINFSERNNCGSMAANGNLYLAAKTDDSSHDMFCSRPVGSTYDIAEDIPGINSPGPDHCSYVGPDESHIIFSSFRGGLGRSDLYISFRNHDGTWTEPRNMGAEINSAYKDEYPYVSPDGKYLFFNSNRPSSLNPKPIEDGPGNIYWIKSDIIDSLKPQELKSGGKL